MPLHDWSVENDTPITYLCSMCSASVSSDQGWALNGLREWAFVRIRLCPKDHPTIFYYMLTKSPNKFLIQIPSPQFGKPVDKDHVPEHVHLLYVEARGCISNGAYTCSVMACRKLLMNIAVEKGAPEGESFIRYVEFLGNEHLVPVSLTSWLQYIRSLGNEANHEIAQRTKEEAERAIIFMEQLINLIYVFPRTSPEI